MGIDDRDYVRIRHASGRRAGSRGLGMRMWSVTTWLIVACFAVYLVDALMPGAWYEPVMVDVEPRHLRVDPDAVIFSQPRILSVDAAGRPLVAETLVFQPTAFGHRQMGSFQTLYLAPIEYYLHYSTQKGFLGFQYWRFIGYQFLHANLPHILLNMIGLFIFGPIVEEALGRKRFLAFYLLCGIFGALLFSVLNLLGYIAIERGISVSIPGLLFNLPSTPLVGASASVFGVMVAGAVLEPRTIIWVLLFPVRLPILALILVVVALVVVLTGGANAGGQAAHLGGAFAGWYFIRNRHHLHGFFDILGYADPTSHHYRDKRIERQLQQGGAVRPSTARIDQILDKINAKGLSSLTAEEKRILNDATRDR